MKNETNEKFAQDLVEILDETAAGQNLDSNLRAIDKCIQDTEALKEGNQGDDKALDTILLIEATLLSIKERIQEAISALVN